MQYFTIMCILPAFVLIFLLLFYFRLPTYLFHSRIPRLGFCLSFFVFSFFFLSILFLFFFLLNYVKFFLSLLVFQNLSTLVSFSPLFYLFRSSFLLDLTSFLLPASYYHCSLCFQSIWVKFLTSLYLSLVYYLNGVSLSPSLSFLFVCVSAVLYLESETSKHFLH